MSDDTLFRLQEILRRERPTWIVDVEGGGAPVPFLAISGLAPDRGLYLVGDVNRTWGADYYASVADLEDGQPSTVRGFSTSVLATTQDAAVIAQAILAGIDAEVTAHVA